MEFKNHKLYSSLTVLYISQNVKQPTLIKITEIAIKRFFIILCISFDFKETNSNTIPNINPKIPAIIASAVMKYTPLFFKVLSLVIILVT